MHLPKATFETSTYSVHWIGRLSPGDLSVHFYPDAHIHLLPEEVKAVDDTWQALLQQRRRVQNSALYRLMSAVPGEHSLSLDFGITSYREYQGTNVKRPTWAVADSFNKMSNPIALSMVGITRDEQVMVHYRSDDVGEYGGRRHVTPSGHLHPPQTLTEAAHAELWEELGVCAGELDDEITVTGLIVNKSLQKPELTLMARLKPTAKEILGRSPVDRWEYVKLEPVPWCSTTIQEVLLGKQELTWVPPGHAALLLAGRLEFGEAWSNRMLNLLTS